MDIDVKVIFKAKFFSHGFDCFCAEVVTKIGKANIITSDERIKSAWAFRESPDNGWLRGDNWCVGDPYGTEIATLNLPNGYVFGTSGMPSSIGETKEAGKPQFFDPDTLDAETVKGSKFRFDTIAISSIRPGSDTPKKFDSVSKNDLDDDD